MQKAGSKLENAINSIGKNNKFSTQAAQWALEWLTKHAPHLLNKV